MRHICGCRAAAEVLVLIVVGLFFFFFLLFRSLLCVQSKSHFPATPASRFLKWRIFLIKTLIFFSAGQFWMLWTNTTFFFFPSTEPFSLRHIGLCLCCHSNPHFPMRQLTAPTNCLHCTAAPYLWASVNKLHRSSYYTAPFFVQRHLLFKSRTICCLYRRIVQRVVEKTTTTTAKKTGWREFVRALRNVFSGRVISWHFNKHHSLYPKQCR